MGRVLLKSELPAFDSTRDGRDRLDLLTENVPVWNGNLRADRILYHPGDTCAKHYHVGAHHLFVMLEGEVELHTPVRTEHLKAGMAAIVEPEEIHWFENTSDANACFVEFWAPPPKETIWISEDDI